MAERLVSGWGRSRLGFSAIEYSGDQLSRQLGANRIRVPAVIRPEADLNQSSNLARLFSIFPSSSSPHVHDPLHLTTLSSTVNKPPAQATFEISLSRPPDGSLSAFPARPSSQVFSHPNEAWGVVTRPLSPQGACNTGYVIVHTAHLTSPSTTTTRSPNLFSLYTNGQPTQQPQQWPPQ